MKFAESVAKHREDPEYRRLEQELDLDIRFGEEVYLARRAKGITQTELARRVGTRQANISRIEAGFGNPKLAMVSKISAVLGISWVPVPCLTGDYSTGSKTESIPVPLHETISDSRPISRIGSEKSASGKSEKVYA